MKMERVAGIGEMVLSQNENDVLVTYALSSCVAVTAYSPSRRGAAMAHIALPGTLMNNKYSRPCYYADTGVPYFINAVCVKIGCSKEELVISIFGGAVSIRGNDRFNIGPRNTKVIKEIIRKMNLSIFKEETGGTSSRSLKMHAGTGKISIIMHPMDI